MSVEYANPVQKLGIEKSKTHDLLRWLFTRFAVTTEHKIDAVSRNHHRMKVFVLVINVLTAQLISPGNFSDKFLLQYLGFGQDPTSYMESEDFPFLAFKRSFPGMLYAKSRGLVSGSSLKLELKKYFSWNYRDNTLSWPFSENRPN